MKIAVVTGSSGGLGRALMAEMQQSGLRAIGIDLQPGQDISAPFYQVDLADAQSIQAAFDKIRAEHGPVSVLVNNAGYVSSKNFLDVTLQDLDLTLAVNLRAVFIASQIAARQMIEAGEGGCIVNVSSFAARTGTRSVEYGASKGGIDAMTKGMAKTLAPHGIRVNAIAPGIVDTPMHRKATPEFRARQMEAVYLGRAAEPHEVASVVGFLASDRAAYVTGAIYDTNGGMG